MNPSHRYYIQRFKSATHDELVAEIIRLHQGYGTELGKIEELACEALNLPNDPDYGYPVTDTYSAVAQLADALKTPPPPPPPQPNDHDDPDELKPGSWWQVIAPDGSLWWRIK